MAYKGVQIWTEAVFACPTFSRLHFLMSVLHSCVKWEKSAEDAVSRMFDLPGAPFTSMDK